MTKRFTFIDLFAGAGGFAEGFYQEDYQALSHVEFDKYACDTLRERMKFYNYSEEEIETGVVHKDITDKDIIDKMNLSIKNNVVDMVIGGPPCQSFSSQGKARDPNGMKCDCRNYLYENYIKILDNYKPKFFVFENVRGILSTKLNGKLIIDDIFQDMKKNYNILEDTNKILLDASNFGVPQERKRVIIIGMRKDLKTDFTIEDIYNDLEEISKRQPKTTVLDAISDLPKLKAGEGKEILKHSPIITNDYLKLLRHPEQTTIHHHVVRKHNNLDIERYKQMSKNKWTLAELYSNRPDLIHSKKRLFNNSYAVQRYDKPSKTIMAHLYKDGNQFIHPDFTQQRTFTPREAARIQSFPDNFVFPCSTTQQYKQIGNAVPPLLAKHIAKLLKKYLEKLEK